MDKVGEIARKNLDDIPYNTRASWGCLIEESKVKFNGLKKTYKNTLFQKSVGIFVTGNANKVTEFCKFVTEGNEGLVVDAQSLYNRLADGLEPTFSSARHWGIAQTYKLTQLLMEVMSELGLSEIPAPSKVTEQTLATPADVRSYVRKIIRDTCGDNLNRNYLEEQASEAAYMIRYSGNLTPVVIVNAYEDEFDNLGKAFSRCGVRVGISDDDVVDKEYVTKALGNVAKQLKKK